MKVGALERPFLKASRRHLELFGKDTTIPKGVTMPYDHLGTWTRELDSDHSARLDLWDTGSVDSYGKSNLRYALAFIPEPPSDTSRRVVIWEGEDYHPSPLISIDSDESAAGLLGFASYYGETGDEDAIREIPVRVLDMLQEHSEELSFWSYELEQDPANDDR